jgi:hypothetical protein
MRFFLAAMLLLVPMTSWATTVRQAPLEELVRESHMVVRAHVAFVDERAGEATGKFQTRIGFEIIEAVKGMTPGAETYELVIPGGSVNQYTMAIPGMPSFTPGQEVVVLVKHTEAGDTITGLAQGIFAVDRSSGAARARRFDAGEVRLVDALGRDTKAERLELPLGDLMDRLRTLSREVSR